MSTSNTITRTDLANILNEVLPVFTPPNIKMVMWGDSSQTVGGYGGLTRDNIDVTNSIPSGYTMIAVIPAMTGSYACYFYNASMYSSTSVSYQIGNRESSSKTISPKLVLVCVHNQLLSVDHIVEQGTSAQAGITWTYRKWNSGKAECWGTYTFSSATFASTGNVYYRAITGIPYPTGLFNATPNVIVSVRMGNVGGSTVDPSSSSFNVGILSSVSTARSGDIYAHCIGTWK